MYGRRFVLVALTFGLCRKLYQLVREKLRDRFDGLDGVVSFSSRMIAASRAVETEREDHVIDDPLAKVLAGKSAYARAKERAAANSDQQQEGKGRLIPKLVIRTRFFDDAVLGATGIESVPQHSELTRALGHSPGCTQVVMLGAGMDSRPWRLPLPSGVSWFEVDRQDVLRAKQTTLQQAGAPTDKGDQGISPKFPLKASSWQCVSCDLQTPGWSQELCSVGYQRDQPTIWVAEGLLTYLRPDTVQPMLKEVAASCPHGSILCASVLLEATRKLVVDTPPPSASESPVPLGPKGQRLVDTWVWGCPDNVEEFFANCGWTVVVAPRWWEAIEQYGWVPQLSEGRVPKDKSFRLLVAIKA